MKRRVTLSVKEQTRLVVLNEVEAGRLNMPAASEVMRVSTRQARRLGAAYLAKGVEGLAHGNRGQRPHSAVDACLNVEWLLVTLVSRFLKRGSRSYE